LALVVGAGFALHAWWASPDLIGLSLALSPLLVLAFLRQVCYVRRNPVHAAAMSSVGGVALLLGLALVLWRGHLNGFWAFVLLGFGALPAIAMFFLHRPVAASNPRAFLRRHTGYWNDHWVYARWTLATAFVYQFLNQAYYWLLALS